MNGAPPRVARVPPIKFSVPMLGPRLETYILDSQLLSAPSWSPKKFDQVPVLKLNIAGSAVSPLTRQWPPVPSILVCADSKLKHTNACSARRLRRSGVLLA